MTFLVLIIGLLVLRFGGDIRGLQKDDWFVSWCGYLESVEWLRHRDGLRSVLAVLLPVLGLAVLLWLLRDWWLGLPISAISLVVLLYSLGRGDLETELRVYREAVSRGDTQAAYHGAAPFNPTHRDGMAANWPELQQELEAGLPYRLFEREFAVIFWFAVLGPAGALLYRLARLRADHVARELEGSEALDATVEDEGYAPRLLGLLEWLPARLLVPSLALVGNFSPVMQQAVRLCLGNLSANALLAELVRVALVLQREDIERPGGLELVTAIEDLLRRALVLWVLVVALLVLFA